MSQADGDNPVGEAIRLAHPPLTGKPIKAREGWRRIAVAHVIGRLIAHDVTIRDAQLPALAERMARTWDADLSADESPDPEAVDIYESLLCEATSVALDDGETKFWFDLTRTGDQPCGIDFIDESRPPWLRRLVHGVRLKSEAAGGGDFVLTNRYATMVLGDRRQPRAGEPDSTTGRRELRMLVGRGVIVPTHRGRPFKNGKPSGADQGGSAASRYQLAVPIHDPTAPPDPYDDWATPSPPVG